jgi:hypothetical protein
MISHGGNRTRGFGVGGRAHRAHQSRARPPGGRIVAGAILLGSVFAIGRERGIDDALIERQDVLGAQSQAFADRTGKIRDEHIGARDEQFQHGARTVLFEIERQALLVAVVEQPEVIVLRGAAQPGEERDQRRIAEEGQRQARQDEPDVQDGEQDELAEAVKRLLVVVQFLDGDL